MVLDMDYFFWIHFYVKLIKTPKNISFNFNLFYHLYFKIILSYFLLEILF